MEFTGERFIPTISGDIRLEHYHRYHWCTDLVQGKRVLDIASGEGYGSDLLATWAQEVFGVDISDEAVQHATFKYGGKKSNLSFLHGSAAEIPLPDDSIDIAISFETIEHHTQHEEMLSEIKRVLTNDGVLVLSSPNKKIYSDQAGGDHNHFHIKELYFDELDALLKKYFISVKYLGQRSTAVSLMQELSPQPLEKFNTIFTESPADIRTGIPINIEPMYFIAVATNSKPPSIQIPTAFFSEIDNALQERTLEVMKLGKEIRRMSEYIAEVHQVLEIREHEIRRTQEALTECTAELKIRDSDLHRIKSSYLWKISHAIAKMKK